VNRVKPSGLSCVCVCVCVWCRMMVWQRYTSASWPAMKQWSNSSTRSKPAPASQTRYQSHSCSWLKHLYGPAALSSSLIKLKFHGSSFLVASSWHPRENVAKMSQKIGCVGHVGRGCYEDPGEDVRSKSPTDQSGKRVVYWTRKSPDTPDTPDIHVASSRGCRACRRRCHDDATRKLLPWNLSISEIEKYQEI